MASTTSKEENVVDFKKKNENLTKEVERLTALVSKSERKRRKQKIVYEKNMENLSIRLTDFESNLRKEQKEIQDLISKKDQQIKVREELVKTLREKSTQQFCNQCGCANPKVSSMDVDWELDIDEDQNEVIKKLPPLDLPPPEENKNISFTNHRPFRPKSKLPMVAEDSELSLGSSLRNVHADLMPDRFHAALTASLGSLLNDTEDGVDTPTNSIGGDSNEDTTSVEEKLADSEPTIAEASTEVNHLIIEPSSAPAQVVINKKVSSQSNDLLSFSDKLSANILSLVNQDLVPQYSQPCPSNRRKENICNIQTFCANIVTKNLLEALNEVSTSRRKERPSASPSSNHKHSKMKRLHTAAVTFVDQFISNDFVTKSFSQRSPCQRVTPIPSDEIPDQMSQEDTIHIGDQQTNIDGNPNQISDPHVPFDDDDKFVVIEDKRLPLDKNADDPRLNAEQLLNEKINDSRSHNKEANENPIDDLQTTVEPNDNPTMNGQLHNEELSEKLPPDEITEQRLDQIDRQQRLTTQSNDEMNEKQQTKELIEQRPATEEKSVSRQPTDENSPPNDASPESTKNKKKKKKKKKKRKSVSNEIEESDVVSTTNETGSRITDNTVMEPVKSPVEDKFSLTLDNQLDQLGESPTSPTHVAIGDSGHHEEQSQTTRM